MTNEAMDRLANESIQESGMNIKIFFIDHVQEKAHVWALSFSDKNNKFYEVEIDLWTDKTEAAIKDEIKRQLAAAQWTHDFFDPTPEQQSVVLINSATLQEAERLIESCEGCNPEGAQIFVMSWPPKECPETAIWLASTTQNHSQFAMDLY
jgi:transcription initiation factor IIF auxiliary subunit